MPLSEHEQRLLDQLEKQLNAEDPRFAHSMSAEPAGPVASSLGARNIVAGVLLLLVGLGVILTGVSLKIIAVGVLGFLIAVGGIYWALQPGKDAPSGVSASRTPGAAASQKKSSFMQGLEDRWDERRSGR